jgi:hypothetical protein
MKLTVSNPLNSESLDISEFTMNDMRNIAFMVESNLDNALYDFLISKLSGDGNCITKFIALFKAREQFIGDSISLSNGSSNINIQLAYWFEEFSNHLIDIRGVVAVDDFEIIIDYPSSLIHKVYDELLMDMIQSINIKGNIINFKNISISEKMEIIQKMPYNVIREVYNYINNSNFEIVVFKQKLGLPDIKFTLFDNSAFTFIKMMFNYYRYDEIMETIFMISSRISDIGFLMSRTPKDINLLVKLYSEEVEKANSEDKSSYDQHIN